MIIIKVGGGKNINWSYVCQDFASLIKKEKAILVHGASSRRNELAQKLGHPIKTVISPSGISSVYTDKKAMEIFLMSYAGLANKQVVARLQRLGVNAFGFSGLDGRLWEGKRKRHILVKENGKTKLLKDNLTGRVEKVNVMIIQMLIQKGFTPVICPPAISYQGEIINVDNDLAIAEMAKELSVKRIVSLFEAPGLLINLKDESSLIKTIKGTELESYLRFAKGGMQKKILGAKRALEMGVREIYWGDGRVKEPITKALAGKGTVIKNYD